MYNTVVAVLEIKCFFKKLKQNCEVYEIHRWQNVWELRSLMIIITTIIYIMQTVDNTYLDLVNN